MSATVEKFWKNARSFFEKLAAAVEDLWKIVRETFERLAKVAEAMKKPRKNAFNFSAKRPKDSWTLYKAPTPARVRQR